MADISDSPRMFIPYISRHQSTRRSRELLLSTARRHAASTVYKRKQRKVELNSASTYRTRKADLCLHTERPHPQKSNACVQGSPLASEPWLLPSDVAGGSIDGDLRQDLTDDLHSPSLTSSAYNRSTDWNFGCLGAPSRQLTELDFAVLDYFLERRPERRNARDPFVLTVSAKHDATQVSEGLLRQAMYSTALLDSLTAFTALNMMDKHPRAHDLKALAERRAQLALHGIRQALAVSDPAQSLDVAFSILYLCMGCVFLGRLDDAKVHLKYLAMLMRDLRVMSPYKQRFLYHLRCCDLRYALQAGQAPVVPSDLINQQWSDSSPSQTDTSSPITSIVEEHLDLLPPSLAIRSPVADRSNGFTAAIECGLLTESMWYIIQQYIDCIHYHTRLTEKAETELFEMTQFRKQSLACIDEVCAQWSRTHEPDLTDHRETLGSPSAGTLDYVIVIAIQIHVLICMGRTSGQAICVLSRRLRKFLYQCTGCHDGTIHEHEDEGAQLRTQLLLWVFLMGMLAKVVKNTDFEWFRQHAVKLCGRLELNTVTNLLNTLKQFGPHDDLPGRDLVEVVTHLMAYMTKLRSKDQQGPVRLPHTNVVSPRSPKHASNGWRLPAVWSDAIERVTQSVPIHHR